MLERDINARSLVVWALWTLSLAMWAVSLSFDPNAVGRLSIIVAAIAATADMKRMFIEQRQYLKTVASVTSVANRSVRSLN